MITINLKKRIGAVATAALMASCLAAPSAFAAVYSDDTLTQADINALPSAAVDVTTDSRPTAAASRAAMPAVEILGLAGVEESGQFVSLQDVSVYDKKTDVTTTWVQPKFTWSAPKYLIFASSYSSQPSPYLVNFALHQGTMAAYNPSRGGTGAGPNAILAASGDTTDDAVWALNPSIIIGDGGKSSTELDTYHAGYTHANYIKYNVSHYSDIISTVTAIRNAVNYSAVTTTANAYNTYIQSAANTVSGTKKVALVTNYSDGLYTIGASSATDGTATQNRYLETALYAGATNLNTNTTATAMTVNSTTLASADLILVGGQQGSSNYTAIMTQLLKDKLLNKTYFVKDNGMGVGSTYGVVMNSIENAQNIARILQPITGLNQRDTLATYFQNYYHINSANLAHVMDKSLDGVRNWNRSIDWTTFTFDSSDDASVASALSTAVAYLTDWPEDECGFTPTAQ